MTDHLRSTLFAVALSSAFALVACGQASEAESLAKADKLVESSDLRAAAVQLRHTIQMFPASAEARVRFGEVLIRQGDATAAEIELQKALQMGGDVNRAIPLLARTLLAQSKSKTLIDSLGDRQLPNAKAQSQLRALLAAGYAAQGQLERSAAAAEEALLADPENVSAKLVLARLALGRKDVDRADALIEEVLRRHPKTREAWLLKGELAWVVRGQRADAESALRKALEIDPTYVDAHASLLQVLRSSSDMNSYRRQVDVLQQKLPQHPETLLHLARLAQMDGKSVEARQLASQLLQQVPDNGAVLELAGAIEVQAGSLVLAETHLSKALQVSPELVAARQLLAQTYLRSGQPVRALATLEPLLQLPEPQAGPLALAAEAHLLAGDPARAEQLYARAMTSSPDAVPAQVGAALSQIAQGKVEQGLGNLEKIAAGSTSNDADLALISSQLRLGRTGQALDSIDKLSAKAPASPFPYLLRSDILTKIRDFSRARASLEKALSLDPAYLPAVIGLSQLDARQGRSEAGVERLKRYVTSNPASPHALRALAELQSHAGAPATEVRSLLETAVRSAPRDPTSRVALIDHLLIAGDAASAQTVAQDAAAVLPDDTTVADALGRALLANRATGQALTAFNRAIALRPNRPEAYLRLADVHLRLQDYDSARQLYVRALEMSPRLLQAQQGIMQIAVLQGRPEAGVALARSIQAQRPSEGIGHVLEADLHSRYQRWSQAVSALRRAFQLEPTQIHVSRLHEALWRAGERGEAERLAREWRQSHPKDTAFLLYLGSTALAQGQMSEAEGLFRQVLALHDDEITALNNLAWILAEQKRSGAVTTAMRALALSPAEPGVLDTAALALASEGRLTEAIVMQRRALARAVDNPVYEFHLAKMLAAAQQFEEAKNLLQKVARLGTGFDRQDDVSKLLQSLETRRIESASKGKS